jgi:hypothetical protein
MPPATPHAARFLALVKPNDSWIQKMIGLLFDMLNE